MRPGIDSPPEIKAQALALYTETQSSYAASDLMAEIGIKVTARTIQRWSEAEDGHVARLSQERRNRLSDNWFTVASQGSERMVDVIKHLPPAQVAVPAAIATDKYLKLTEEQGTGNAPSVSVFVGVKVEK